MYRRTSKYANRRKWHPRPAVPVDEQRASQWRPPKLRRRIVIEDFDGAEPCAHVIEMYRTNRIDSYRVEIDGKPWAPAGRQRIGWSRVLDWTRKALPRLASPKHADE